jgi:tRNA (cmo5U34)-methyltransferase
MLLERYPGAEICLLDASAGMLEQARQRFTGNAAISFAVADMVTADLKGPWDLVMSALAIHHLYSTSRSISLISGGFEVVGAFLL